jgi:hypothetical protein
MTGEVTLLVLCVFGITSVPVLVVALSLIGFHRSGKTGKIIWGIVGGISSLPILAVLYGLGWLVILNAPFTSGVIAYASTPAGDEACVVQSSAIIEYHVSLYARHRGEAWNWNYLGYDDDRWRKCRVEFAGDQLRVYRAGALQKSLLITEAMATKGSDFQMPAEYTPEQICARHNAKSQP